MHRSWLLFVILLLFPAVSPAQTASADTQTLQNLVNELHQLRQDLKTMATAMERGQILFHRLQIQQAAVDRAMQRLDDARAKLASVEANRKEVAASLKFLEGKEAKSSTEQKDVEEVVAQFKARLEGYVSDEQEKQGEYRNAKSESGLSRQHSAACKRSWTRSTGR